MYYCQILKFPRLPDHLIDLALGSIQEYEVLDEFEKTGNYRWHPLHPEVQEWLNANILEGHWGIQTNIDDKDLAVHVDRFTPTRILYTLDPGGPNVTTTFYENDRVTPIESTVLQTHTWYALKSDVFHAVHGIVPGQTRIAITVRFFTHHESNLPVKRTGS